MTDEVVEVEIDRGRSPVDGGEGGLHPDALLGVVQLGLHRPVTAHGNRGEHARLRPDATLLVIDLNEDFIVYLRKTIRDSRFIAVHGSAADVNEIIAQFGFKNADYILSGLPFSTLPNDLGPVIAENTAKALRPGGAFLVYQFRARARDFMEPHFRKIDNGFELWNVLPCHLFWGWKE